VQYIEGFRKEKQSNRPRFRLKRYLLREQKDKKTNCWAFVTRFGADWDVFYTSVCLVCLPISPSLSLIISSSPHLLISPSPLFLSALTPPQYFMQVDRGLDWCNMCSQFHLPQPPGSHVLGGGKPTCDETLQSPQCIVLMLPEELAARTVLNCAQMVPG
jgi:hypothetical protein